MQRTHASLALLTLVACTSTPREERSPAAEPAQAAGAPAQPPAADGGAPAAQTTTPKAPPEWKRQHALASNGELYVVHVSPAPTAIVDNETFALEVWIATAAAPDELARDVTLAVDAAMPEHGHGMNRVPKITRLEDGHFRVEGLLFHMTGHWELYFDVTRGAVTERAQCDIVLE